MNDSPQLPDDFIQLCQSVTAKRPKTVIDHILKYGFITTEDLKVTYGYNHPPRAARDVREHCENWQSLKDKSICRSCYWAYPESYTHVGMRQVRRVDLLWEGDNVRAYEALQQRAISLEKEIPELIKGRCWIYV